MSNGTFAPAALGPYTFDHQSAWDRLQAEQKRQEMDYQARVAAWAIRKLAGEQFTDLESLRARMVDVMSSERTMGEPQYRAIHFASVHLWAGLVDRQIALGRLRISLEPHTVKFLPAA